MINLVGLLIGLIVYAKISQSTEENLRLSNLNCRNYENPSIIPIWQTPDRETMLTEICDFVATLSGLGSNESTTNEDNDVKPSIYLINYRLQLLLSPSPTANDENSISDLYQIDEIELPVESNISADGDLSVDLSSKIRIQPVDFCGYIYLIINLKRADGSIPFTIGSLNKEIEVTCPLEEKTDLRLQVEHENGSLVESSVENRLIIKTNGNSLETLNGIKLSLANRGYSSFRRRCGLKALHTIVFLLPVSRESGADFIKVDGKRFFNIANGHYLRNGDKLIREKQGFCSPFIQINSSIPVNITLLNLIGFTALPSMFDLLIILDPLKVDESVQQSLEQSMFTFSLKLPAGSDSFNLTKCTAIRVVQPSSAFQVIIIHSSDRTPNQINYFGYELLEKKLFILDPQQNSTKISSTTILANKYFYQNWLIGQTIDMYDMYKQSCAVNDQQLSIFKQFSILLQDIASIIGKISTTTSWEEEQMNKLVLSAKVTSTLIKEIVNGDLMCLFLPSIKLIRSLLVQSYSSADRIDKYDQTYFGTIQRVIEEIAESEPPTGEAALIVPKRIRVFLGRLIREGSSAVTYTLPNLKGKLSFLESLRQVIIWILEDVLWDFELPSEISMVLKETINSLNPIIFQSNIEKLAATSDNWSSIETDEEVIKLSTKLFHQLMITTKRDNVWTRYTQIWQLWETRFIVDSQRWIFLEGLPNDPRKSGDNSNYDVDIDEACYRYAIQVLNNRKITPTWFQLDNLEPIQEKEVFQSNQVLFRNNGDSILRGDWEILTGTVFWNRVMLCNCNKTLTDQCSL